MDGHCKDCLVLIPFRLPQISCFTLSIKCFSYDSDNCPGVGIGSLLQLPHWPRAGPVLLTFPPSSFILQRFAWYIYSFPWRRQWHPTPVLLPGKSHGRRSLVDCSPWGREESNMAERLQFHFSLSCIGEGNGNPLQCSCLESPRDGGAWWAAVYGVAQSRTRLKRLSSKNAY